MSKDYLLYVDHILESIAVIESFVSSTNFEQFRIDKIRYHGVLYNLQTMAESTKRLPEHIKQKYPSIPWRNIAGFRNIIVHEYLEGVDTNVVWHIVTNELTALKLAMQQEHP
jgi:uncharacterized protein with HEPN domain